MKVLGYIGGDVSQARKKQRDISFGRSADFSVLQKMNFVTNFMSMQPDKALLKVQRSIKGLPESELALNPALKKLVEGMKKFVSIVAQEEKPEVGSAVVKSFDIQTDVAENIDVVKDSFRKIVFDSIEQSERQPENIYKTFILKLTKGLCDGPKTTPIKEENFIKSHEVFANAPTVLSQPQQDLLIHKLFCLKGEDLKNQFAGAVKLLPPVESESQQHLKIANQFFRNVTEKLSEEEYPYLPKVVSTFLPMTGNQTVYQRFLNMLIKFNNNEQYAPFYRKFSEPLLTKDRAPVVNIQEVAKASDSEIVVKNGKKLKGISPEKKEFADKKLKLLLEGVLVDIETVKLELRKGTLSIKSYNTQISNANKEIERLQELRDFRKIKSDTFRVEEKRKEFLEQIKALEAMIQKRSAFSNNSRYENLMKKHGVDEISDKRIRNKIKRYTKNDNLSHVNSIEKELADLKQAYKIFSRKNPSILDQNNRIKMIEKLLNFDSYYQKTYSELSVPTILSQEDKMLLKSLESKILKLESASKNIESKFHVVQLIDKQPHLVKIDYNERINKLMKNEPTRAMFKTQQGFESAMHSWTSKKKNLFADRELAKVYSQNLDELVQLKAQMDKVNNRKTLSSQNQLALRKLELQKQNVEKYLNSVDSSTSKTGREKLEQELESLKSKLEKMLEGTKNENGTYTSGIRSVWDLDSEISNLKMKNNITISRLNAQQVKQSQNTREKARLQSFLNHKAGGQDEIFEAAKKEVSKLVGFKADMDIQELEILLKDAAKEIKDQKLILVGKLKRPAVNNLNEVEAESATNPFKLTRAQQKKLEKIEVQHSESSVKTSDILVQRKHCQFLLAGGCLEDYGLAPKSAKYIQNRVEHPGYYNMLEDLQEKLNTVTGEEYAKISSEIEALEQEIKDIELLQKDIEANLNIHTKHQVEIRKNIDVVKYNLPR